MVQPVASDIHDGCKWDAEILSSGWYPRDSSGSASAEKYQQYSQPVNLFVMGNTEVELVNHSINSNRSTDEFETCIVGVVEDEVMQVELGQAGSPNASGQLHELARIQLQSRQISTPSGRG